jgi:transposase-like protein
VAERLPDDVRARVADAIRAGGTCRGIAREHAVSTATVRKIAEEFGITGAFSRAKTENATRARVADLADRRARIAEQMLDLADHIAKRATAAYTITVATKDDVHTITLDEPPLGEVRQAMTAVGIALDKHMALIKFDTREVANPVAASLVDRLADLLHLDKGADHLVDDGYPQPLPGPGELDDDGYVAPDMGELTP